MINKKYLMAFLCATVMVGSSFAYCAYAASSYRDEVYRTAQRQETVSVVVNKYVDKRYAGKVHTTKRYIEVFNGDQPVYKFELPSRVYNTVNRGDNVKLVTYTHNGNLYNALVVTEEGEQIPCTNYIEERDSLWKILQ